MDIPINMLFKITSWFIINQFLISGNTITNAIHIDIIDNNNPLIKGIGFNIFIDTTSLFFSLYHMSQNGC